MKKIFAILVLSLGFIGFTKYIKGKRREYSNLILEEELPKEEIKKETEIPKEEELLIKDKLPIEEILSNEEDLKLKEPEVNIVKGTIPHHKRKRTKGKNFEDKSDQLPIIQEMIRDFLGADTIEELTQLIDYIPVAPYISDSLEDNDDNLIGNVSIDKLEKLVQYLTDYERQVLVEFTIQLIEEYKEDNDYTEQSEDLF